MALLSGTYLIASIIDGEYPPLQSVPNPTLTPAAADLRASNKPLFKDTLELGQWDRPAPIEMQEFHFLLNHLIVMTMTFPKSLKT